MGLRVTQLVGTLLDGAARHTPEGEAFTRRALQDIAAAVKSRDQPFGDYGLARPAPPARPPRAARAARAARRKT
jgi:hypothetical protein